MWFSGVLQCLVTLVVLKLVGDPRGAAAMRISKVLVPQESSSQGADGPEESSGQGPGGPEPGKGVATEQVNDGSASGHLGEGSAIEILGEPTSSKGVAPEQAGVAEPLGRPDFYGPDMARLLADWRLHCFLLAGLVTMLSFASFQRLQRAAGVDLTPKAGLPDPSECQPAEKGHLEASSAAGLLEPQAPPQAVRSQEQRQWSFGGWLSKNSLEVQRLLGLGRVFDAERLLRGPEQGHLPAADAASLQQVIAAARLFVRESESVAGEGWRECGYAGVHTRGDISSGFVELMGSEVLDADPLQLWAVFCEFDLSPMVLTKNEFAHPIYKFTASRELYHFRTQPFIPHMMPSTEAFQDRHYVDGLDGPQGFLVCVGFAIPVDGNEFEGVDMPPPPSGYKRITTEGRTMIRPEYKEGKLRSVVTWYRKLSVPSLMPEWVFFTAARREYQALMNNHQRVLKAWKGSAHEQRVLHGPRARYYAELRSRLEAVAAAKEGSRDHVPHVVALDRKAA